MILPAGELTGRPSLFEASTMRSPLPYHTPLEAAAARCTRADNRTVRQIVSSGTHKVCSNTRHMCSTTWGTCPRHFGSLLENGKFQVTRFTVESPSTCPGGANETSISLAQEKYPSQMKVFHQTAHFLSPPEKNTAMVPESACGPCPGCGWAFCCFWWLATGIWPYEENPH